MKSMNSFSRYNKKRRAEIFILFALISVLVFSCVPGRKLAYLQAEGGLKAPQPYDSITSTYSLKKEEYKLQPQDIISLRIASITEDQFNFIKQYEEDLGLIRKLNQYSQGEVAGSQGGGNNNNANQMMRGGGGDEGMLPVILDRQNTGFVLDLNGELELPVIGPVKMSGLTIPQAELAIKEKLEGYFETPMVRIQLLNFHFTILGEVENEGRYTSFNPETTIFDAITLAGNLTEFADRANIKIIRTEKGQSKVLYLNTLDEKTLTAENFYLKKDDLIIVAPLQARTTRRYTLSNLSNSLGIISTVVSAVVLIIALSTR